MIKLIHILLFFSVFDSAFAVYRNGTTALNFLEIDVASSRVAMGGAGVSSVNDASATYWNPGGLAFVNKSDILFFNQSWIADISHTYTSIAIPIQGSSVIGLSLNVMNYGDIEVTTLDSQDGTGEFYSPIEYAAGVTYAKKFVNWFGFGTSIKYINSQIWHTSASAFAIDLGVQIYTDFGSSASGKNDGLKLGMSISNYGTQIKYDGLDLIQPIDPSEDYGNFGNVMGQYETSQWELPLLFRFGVSNDFLKKPNQSLNIAIDAIHPNNDKERINIGAEYSVTFLEVYNLYLRAGYKGIHINKINEGKLQFSSPFGPSFGAGISLPFQRTLKLNTDYAVRFVGVLGISQSITIGLGF